MSNKQKQETKKKSLILSEEKLKKQREIDLPFDSTFENKIKQKEAKERNNWKTFLVSFIIIVLILGLSFLLGYFLTSRVYG